MFGDVDERVVVDDPRASQALLLRPVVEYCERKRPGGAAPLDIDPLELKEYLAGIFLIDIPGRGRVPLPLARHRDRRALGLQQHGQNGARDLPEMPEIERWCMRMFQAAVEQKRPVLACGAPLAVRKACLRLRDDPHAVVARRRAGRPDFRGVAHRPRRR